MKWQDILKTISGVAVVVTPLVQTFVRIPLLDTILNAITKVEKLGGTGAEKFQAALELLDISKPYILDQLEKQLGVQIPDAAIDQYIAAQVQANVDLMNAIGLLPKKTQPVTPVTPLK